MSREIKFRAWDTYNQRMVYYPFMFQPTQEHDNVSSPFTYYEDWRDFEDGIKRPCEVMQYTGLKDKNGKEVYDGDIFRVEEGGDFDQQDKIYYLVIVWINEWSMFGCLHAHTEYQAYLQIGISALDEPMFWTYTLEDTASRKFFLCGNIYENPELLKDKHLEG